MQVGGGGNGPYRNMRGFQGSKGGRVSLFICTDCASNHPELHPAIFEDQEIIEIEGDVVYLEKMLEDALSCVKLLKEHWEEMGPVRPTDCPNCTDYSNYPNATHTEECENNRAVNSLQSEEK
jgi:hypothetical protein